MNIFAFATNNEENETYAYKSMLQQTEKDKFFKAIEKEIADHSSHNHWTIMRTSNISSGTKIIIAIWSFKRKRLLDGTLL